MRPKRSLGQNFLIQPSTARKIVEAAGDIRGETVLEIGPGKGILTRALLLRGARVIAVEKDDALAASLSHSIQTEPSVLQVVHGDILETDFSALGLLDHSFVIVANIPYNITGVLLRRILSGQIQPKKAVLLIQKEVAERIVRPKRGENVLSLSIRAYSSPHTVGIVKRGEFKPMPSVDSTILVLENISKDFFDSISESDFFDVLHRGFAHRRKLLRSNIDVSASTLESCGISAAARAEDCSLNEWKCLARAL